MDTEALKGSGGTIEEKEEAEITFFKLINTMQEMDLRLYTRY